MSRYSKQIVSATATPAKAVLFVFLLSGLSGCGSGPGGFQIGGGATTPPFFGPLEAMPEPVTFNSIPATIQNCSNSADCNPSSSIDTRSALHQITIDPDARTVDISSGTFDVSFSEVDFTGRTKLFGNRVEVQDATTERLTILFPDVGANPFNWASYGIWSTLTVEVPSGDRLFDGGALSFGILTSLSRMPRSGTANYSTGFMNGLYVNAARSNFTLSGSANMSANFGTGAITGQFTGINAVPLGADSPLTPFGDINFNATLTRNNFSGSATSTGTGNPLSGSLEGSFYGPTAQEAGGTFRITGSNEHAVGGFAVRRP